MKLTYLQRVAFLAKFELRKGNLIALFKNDFQEFLGASLFFLGGAILSPFCFLRIFFRYILMPLGWLWFAWDQEEGTQRLYEVFNKKGVQAKPQEDRNS